MLTSWYTTSFPSKVAPPGFRYKQTAVTFINNAFANYDGAGYVTALNNTDFFRGDACTAKFTVDPTKGDIFGISFTRTRNPTANCSSNIYYQTGAVICSVYVGTDSRIFFNGTAYDIGPLTAHKADIAIILDMSAKTIKVLASNVVGGAKTLLAEKPFTNVVAGNSLIQFYVDGPSSTATNILAYNNSEFAL